jgi:hypothetical protein
MDRDQRIRERAHSLWEAGGRKEGSHLDNWASAEREHAQAEREEMSRQASEQIIEGDDRPQDAGPDVRPPSFISPD